MHEYELPSAEKPFFYWPIHSVEVAGAPLSQHCFVLFLVHVAFDEIT